MADMNEKNFNELKQSIIDAGLMMHGELQPSREFVFEKKSGKDVSEIENWAICVADEDDELIPLKIYKVVFRPHLETVKVTDESGETLICPQSWFLPISFPPKVKKVLDNVKMLQPA